jgi:hypothetical protein
MPQIASLPCRADRGESVFQGTKNDARVYLVSNEIPPSPEGYTKYCAWISDLERVKKRLLQTSPEWR